MAGIVNTQAVGALPERLGAGDQETVVTPSLVGQAAARKIQDATHIENPNGVREVAVSYPVPLDPVNTVAVTVPVMGPTGQPIDVTLNIVRQPSEPPVDLQITQVPRKEIVLYNAYNNRGHYFHLKPSHQKKLQRIFYDIKQHCLDTNQVPGDATGFTINFSTRVIRFYDPAIRHNRLLDLETIIKQSPNVYAGVLEGEELITRKINKGDIRTNRFAPNNKGASDGATPLYRSNDALQTLPKSTGDRPYNVAVTLAKDVLTDDVQRDTAIRRMGAAETIIKKTRDKVAAEKAPLLPLLQQATQTGNQAEINRLQRIIGELIALEQKLEHVDTTALYSALAFYPTGARIDPQEVSQRAEQLRQLIEQMTEEVRQKTIKDQAFRPWMPEWASKVPLIGTKLRGEGNIEPSRFYPVDVAGLMFSGLEAPQSRVSYTDFCRANYVYSKGDSLEDALLREVLRPGSESRGENPVLTDLFKNVTDPQVLGRLVAETNAAIASTEGHRALLLNGADAKSRVADFRRQAGL